MAVNARLVAPEVLARASVRVIDGPGGAITFEAPGPVLRMFDEAKAREFYVGFLGFTWDWEHRFGENFRLYAQVSRAGLRLHLSGHHGDCRPESTVVVLMMGVHDYQRESAAKDYRYCKPSVEKMPWGDVTSVTDPFGNRIRLTEGQSG